MEGQGEEVEPMLGKLAEQIEKSYTQLLQYARYMCHLFHWPIDDAFDLVQEVFTRIVILFTRGDASASLRACLDDDRAFERFARASIHNGAIDESRGKKRRQQLGTIEADLSDSGQELLEQAFTGPDLRGLETVDQLERLELLPEALDLLPERQRSVLRMKYFGKLSLREMETLTGRSRTRLHVDLAKARDALAANINLLAARRERKG